jgi:hypothetical protein
VVLLVTFGAEGRPAAAAGKDQGPAMLVALPDPEDAAWR